MQGDPGHGVRRARLARHTQVWTSAGGEPTGSSGWRAPDDTSYAVAELRDDRVELLLDEDHARMLVWVARDDLARALTRTITPRPGLELGVGAPVIVRGQDGDVAGIEVLADDLRVITTAAADAIDDVFEAARPPATAARDHAYDQPSLDERVAIRARPDDGAVILAATVAWVPVVEHGRADGWVEVERAGVYVRVRGWVRADQVQTGTIGGTGGGHGYGSSHRVPLPVGDEACLYDAPDGHPIGLEIGDYTRLSYPADADGWHWVMVDSPWGLLDVAVHDLAVGDGAADAAPVWARCGD